MRRCHRILEDRKADTELNEKNRCKVFRCCFQEYIRKTGSARFLSAVVLMFALVCAAATGIDRLMTDTQEWITPWMAPFFFDNIYFVTFYGFIVCYMYSDVPFMNRTELYRIMREGRGRWCIVKLAGIILQAFTMAAVTMAACVIVFFPMVKMEMDWGKIIYTMAYSNNLDHYNVMITPSPVILSKYTPAEAMAVCFMIVWLVTALMGLLMFGISLYSSRILAVSAAVGLTGLNLSGGKFWVTAWLPYVTPFYWCRMSIYGEQIFLDWYYPSLRFYVGVISILIIFFVGMILVRSRHIEFIWNREE